jgi:hypothetical protein
MVSVVKGNLQDFKLDLNRVSLAGKTVETHSINKLANATGAIGSTSTTNAIFLRDNSTQFTGLGDISTNGTVQWKTFR